MAVGEVDQGIVLMLSLQVYNIGPAHATAVHCILRLSVLDRLCTAMPLILARSGRYMYIGVNSVPPKGK